MAGFAAAASRRSLRPRTGPIGGGQGRWLEHVFPNDKYGRGRNSPEPLALVRDNFRMRVPARDPGPAECLSERMLRPWSGEDSGMPVGAIVPTGFGAYARVLHPPFERQSGKRVRWAEVAAINDRIAHPLMEWHLVRTPAPGSDRPLWSPDTGTPTGPPDADELWELATILREFTGTTHLWWYCMWTGYGDDPESLGQPAQARVLE